MGDSPSNAEAGDRDASTAEDRRLVRAAQGGDTGAYASLVAKYRQRIFAMIYGMTRNEQDAWDLSQDAFLRAWKALPGFRNDSAFFTWLYRIARNAVTDWARRRMVEGGTEFDDGIALREIEPAAKTTPGTAPAPDRALDAAEIRARIDDALLKLSGDHREVIVLREIEGYEYHEIAERIGQPLGTVMSRLFYARKKLQTLLRDLHAQL